MAVYATNKKAYYDYEILETFEAGIVLSGPEVKSIRQGGAKLTGGFVTFHQGAALLTNTHITKYQPAGALPDYQSDRSRKLLLKKSQIDYLHGKAQARGLTIVPLSLYTKGPHIKVEIGLARGKKKYDKRGAIKRKEVEREMRRKIKEAGR